MASRAATLTRPIIEGRPVDGVSRWRPVAAAGARSGAVAAALQLEADWTGQGPLSVVFSQ